MVMLRRFVLLVAGLLVVGSGAPAGALGAEGVGCPNEQLRAEQPYGAGLPDCRAYEMVSPLDKGGNNITFADSRAAVSGEAVTYPSTGSFGEPKGDLLEARYVSRRGADGWSTQNVSPPYRPVKGGFTLGIAFEDLLFTPELSEGIVKSSGTPLVGGEPEGYIDLYVADLEAGSYQTVTSITPPEYRPYQENVEPTTGEPQVGGVSTDLSHVVFEQYASLLEGASPEPRMRVYEWAGGRLSQVDVAPEGMTLKDDNSIGAPYDVNEETPYYGNMWHAVSADGSRVVFTGGEGSERSDQLGQVYVREVDREWTLEVSASQRTDCNVQRKAREPGFVCTGAPEPDPSDPVTAEFPNGIRPAFYRDASVDGSRVFFTSRAELTDDANTGPADDAGNLYECEIVEVEGKPACRLSDLTVDTNDGDVDGAAAVGLVTASEDGSYVYFVANGVLAPGAKPGDCKTEPREEGGGERTCSLYVEHYGGAGWEPPKFIATLAGGDGGSLEARADESDWIGSEFPENHGITDDEGPGTHTVRVTPDGTRLAFESDRSLTGYDNEAAQPGECSEDQQGGRCREVYLYDATTGSLVCASCDPGGARPVGPAELGGTEESNLQTSQFVQPSAFYVPRNLSEDGGRLFFQSPDALAPDDSNGLLDVYEWEQPASQPEPGDSCTRSAPSFSVSDGGCVVPVSDVTGGYESHFMDASASGGDVFIATADQLVAGDTDSRVDVYDVRVGGGFPAPAAPSACEGGESCRGPVASQPGVFGAPASAVFSGAGNLASPPATPVVKAKAKVRRCRKGFVKKHSECVRQTPKKKARARAKAGKSDKRSVRGGK